MLRTVALTALLACLAVPAAASRLDRHGRPATATSPSPPPTGEENNVKITREDIALPVGVCDTAAVRRHRVLERLAA